MDLLSANDGNLAPASQQEQRLDQHVAIGPASVSPPNQAMGDNISEIFRARINEPRAIEQNDVRPHCLLQNIV